MRPLLVDGVEVSGIVQVSTHDEPTCREQRSQDVAQGLHVPAVVLVGADVNAGHEQLPAAVVNVSGDDVRTERRDRELLWSGAAHENARATALVPVGRANEERPLARQPRRDMDRRLLHERDVRFEAEEKAPRFVAHGTVSLRRAAHVPRDDAHPRLRGLGFLAFRLVVAFARRFATFTGFFCTALAFFTRAAATSMPITTTFLYAFLPTFFA